LSILLPRPPVTGTGGGCNSARPGLGTNAAELLQRADVFETWGKGEKQLLDCYSDTVVLGRDTKL